MMNARAIRVFVSSVSGGLESTRTQIIKDLNKAGYDVGAMERFGAQPTVPLDVCLNELRDSDAVVLIIGHRYGSLLPQGISNTHAEFREAQGAGIPVLAIRVPDDQHLSADEQAQLEAFATEVGSTTTYDSLAPDETFERISSRVLAALSSARDRGDIEDLAHDGLRGRSGRALRRPRSIAQAGVAVFDVAPFPLIERLPGQAEPPADPSDVAFVGRLPDYSQPPGR